MLKYLDSDMKTHTCRAKLALERLSAAGREMRAAVAARMRRVCMCMDALAGAGHSRAPANTAGVGATVIREARVYPGAASLEEVVCRCPREELKRHHPQRPRVERWGGLDAVQFLLPRAGDLGGSVGEGEVEGGDLADARDAAKVDDGPAVLPRQPHDVGRLEVAVDVPGVMHVGQALGEVRQNLHACGRWVLGRFQSCMDWLLGSCGHCMEQTRWVSAPPASSYDKLWQPRRATAAITGYR